ncbi:MAG TPA: plasmid pRiA4b ORF-3 family protein [Actinophytocola sp.]|uniref:plasmid pRiA4b ORF-3 family protein n=1 Tax=Actinophytocola sp. TaxID=1872138 RepID=UPI002DDCA9F1|nr:plasmid pRiA4b ORF-3 family protein [Actinophytocola sp.]HEV2779593.1 plasmid pRiA4b ORF-3 family protein [Actinophytocola sp.]
MSPVSRGRKPKKRKKTAKRPAPVGPLATLESCDCPVCTGQEFDLSTLIDDLLADAAGLAERADPMAAELLAAGLVALCELSGEPFDDALADGIVPHIEDTATTDALILLLALGSVADGRAGKAAGAAADRLAAAGVPRPGWAAELAKPVTAGDCWRLADPDASGSLLVCTFHRAGRSHALMVGVDHGDRGAAAGIMLLDAAELTQAIEQGEHPAAVKERLDPAELRWQAECALDARAAHDAETGEAPYSEPDIPDYYPLSVLLRARLRRLPDSGKPKPAHAGGTVSALRLRGTPKRKVPPKPTARPGPAPMYQMKVSLRGATPPIWRRLEVPADISLARLHLIIQVAFGWDGYHLHVFETPYGDFGISEPELGHQPQDSVSLEQVLPGEGDRITYTYDFGDGWRHDIVVEKVLDPDGSATYPRCTGGRSAGPPEDCGGIGGYAYLLDVLADPSHPEHEERLDWLGLDSAEEFDPAAFDAATVTKALSNLG